MIDEVFVKQEIETFVNDEVAPALFGYRPKDLATDLTKLFMRLLADANKEN